MSDVDNVSRKKNEQVEHLNRQILECFRRNVQNANRYATGWLRRIFGSKLVRTDDNYWQDDSQQTSVYSTPPIVRIPALKKKLLENREKWKWDLGPDFCCKTNFMMILKIHKRVFFVKLRKKITFGMNIVLARIPCCFTKETTIVSFVKHKKIPKVQVPKPIFFAISEKKDTYVYF